MSPSPRLSFALAGACCAALTGYAYFAQFVQGYEPCPLCIFQRLAMIVVMVVLFTAALHGPGRVGRAVYGALAAVVSLGGAGIAARHVWLQNLPPERIPDCGPGLDYLLDVFPLWDAVRLAFTGSGECAEVDWVLLGLSMPGWVLLAFTGLAVFSAWNGFRRE